MKPDRKFNKVSVIGLGYVGLPTAAMLASRGVKVLGVDTNPTTVSSINRGKAHIVEPDLDMMVNAAVAGGMLSAAGKPEAADAFIVAVPTPFAEGKSGAPPKPDLSHLMAAADSLAPVLEAGGLVVIESTCPVGTTEVVCRRLAGLRPDLSFPHKAGERADIKVAHSPDRVLPGRVLVELAGNDRVIGGISPSCAERAAGLYKLFVNGQCLLTNAATAEMVKLAENAYRDVNIAFANELSLVCEKLGVDVWEALQLANHHPRVDILKPGPGVGGHCIAVDPWFLADSAPAETTLIQAARRVNDSKPGHVAEKVLKAAEDMESPIIACLGLSYKADIDDLRQSPAIDIVKRLAGELDGEVLVVEPHAEKLPEELEGVGRVSLSGLDEALEAADIVVLLVDHRAFRDLDRTRLEGKTVIDTRGAWR